MSENGPREGTRDLPRPGPEAGRRSVEPDSPAGVAYGSIARSLRRRREELIALAAAGEDPAAIPVSYLAEHPLEPAVSRAEVNAAVAEAKARASRKSTASGDSRRPRPK